MSTNKHISSLCKFYSVYEEKSEEVSDETDVGSYFYHNILDILQYHHRIVRVSKGSNKKSFAFKVFHFQRNSSDLFSRKKSAFSKRKLNLYSTVWVNFSKLLIKSTKYPSSHYPNLNLRVFTEAKDKLFSHCYSDIVEQGNRQI